MYAVFWPVLGEFEKVILQVIRMRYTVFVYTVKRLVGVCILELLSCIAWKFLTGKNSRFYL